MSADRIFTTSEFQKRYESVDVSVFSPKAALVPSQFFISERAREILADVVKISDSDVVEYVHVPDRQNSDKGSWEDGRLE